MNRKEDLSVGAVGREHRDESKGQSIINTIVNSFENMFGKKNP